MSGRPGRIPPHGTPARYKGTKRRPCCRCRPCTRAAVRDAALRELDTLAGRPRTVPAAPVRDHIKMLLAAGLTTPQIGRAAGVHETTITRALLTHTRVLRSTAEKILAVPPSHRPDTGRRPALGVIRRLRALHWLGYDWDTLAVGLHRTAQYLQRLARGQYTTVDAAFERAVRRRYVALITTRGPSRLAACRALAYGWHGPLAWDGIDNPHAEPETSRHGIPGSWRASRGERVAEARRLVEEDRLRLEDAAEIVGMSERTVWRWQQAGWPLAVSA